VVVIKLMKNLAVVIMLLDSKEAGHSMNSELERKLQTTTACCMLHAYPILTGVSFHLCVYACVLLFNK
jgi:hypothetical protein